MEIDRDPVQDLDRIHGTGIWNNLKIEKFTLSTWSLDVRRKRKFYRGLV